MKTSYKIVNEFHGFEASTEIESEIETLCEEAKPSDCESTTYIYRVENGKIVARMDWNGSKLEQVS